MQVREEDNIDLYADWRLGSFASGSICYKHLDRDQSESHGIALSHEEERITTFGRRGYDGMRSWLKGNDSDSSARQH